MNYSVGDAVTCVFANGWWGSPVEATGALAGFHSTCYGRGNRKVFSSPKFERTYRLSFQADNDQASRRAWRVSFFSRLLSLFVHVSIPSLGGYDDAQYDDLEEKDHRLL